MCSSTVAPMANVQVVETGQLRKGEYRAVLGFAGVGFAGGTACMFIARSRGLRMVAYVSSPLLPPMTLVVNGELAPSFRIYADEENRLLYAVTELLLSPDASHAVASELVKWMREKGVKEIYIMDGYPGVASPEGPKALGIAQGIDLSKAEVIQLREGAVSGLSSSALEACRESGIPFAVLLIPTTKLTTIDHSASADAVETLAKIFKIELDASMLRNAAGTVAQPKQKGSILGKFKPG